MPFIASTLLPDEPKNLRMHTGDFYRRVHPPKKVKNGGYCHLLEKNGGMAVCLPAGAHPPFIPHFGGCTDVPFGGKGIRFEEVSAFTGRLGKNGMFSVPGVA